MMAVMGLPLVWLLFKGSARRHHLSVIVPAIAATAVLLSGVLYSGSRSGVLALAVVTIILVHRMFGVFSSLLAAGLSLTLIALVGLPSVDTPATERLSSSTNTAQSDAARLDAMRNGLDQLSGSRWLLGTALPDGQDLPHNIVLLVWIGMGLLGLIAFFTIVWHSQQPLFRRSSDIEAWGLAVAITGFLLALSVNNALPAPPAWLILALLQVRRGVRPPAGPVIGTPSAATRAATPRP
jgi:hypothetical protein